MLLIHQGNGLLGPGYCLFLIIGTASFDSYALSVTQVWIAPRLNERGYRGNVNWRAVGADSFVNTDDCGVAPLPFITAAELVMQIIIPMCFFGILLNVERTADKLTRCVQVTVEGVWARQVAGRS